VATDQQGVQPASSGPLAVETDERTARAGWRSSIVGALIVTLILGVWLALSAAILDYSEPAAPVILGILIAILALLRLFGPIASRTLALTTAVAGGLTALTAFLMSDGPGETANQALIGLAVVVLSLIGLAADAERSRSSRP
jgi:peptidoglycan/LPS O-acetylase OafA/YrhL